MSNGRWIIGILYLQRGLLASLLGDPVAGLDLPPNNI